MTGSSEKAYRIGLAVKALIVALALHVFLCLIIRVNPLRTTAAPEETPKLMMLTLNGEMKQFVERHDPADFLRSDSPHGFAAMGGLQERNAADNFFRHLFHVEPALPQIRMPYRWHAGSGRGFLLAMPEKAFALPELPAEQYFAYDEKKRRLPLQIKLEKTAGSGIVVQETAVRRNCVNGVLRYYVESSCGVPALDRAVMNAVVQLGMEREPEMIRVYWNLKNARGGAK